MQCYYERSFSPKAVRERVTNPGREFGSPYEKSVRRMDPYSSENKWHDKLNRPKYRSRKHNP
jgi:hypothetical protein